MICKSCGNKAGFLSVVTDYKPLELWEFNEGNLTRYCQKDAGDVEMEIQCAACGSEDVDTENFDTGMYSERPLVILSDEEWEGKVAEIKKEEEKEEDSSADASPDGEVSAETEEEPAEKKEEEDASAEASAEAEETKEE